MIDTRNSTTKPGYMTAEEAAQFFHQHYVNFIKNLRKLAKIQPDGSVRAELGGGYYAFKMRGTVKWLVAREG